VRALALFLEIACDVVWCTMATVDRRNRPRSRVVHPVWTLSGDELLGVVGTRPTALKRAHLEHSPFVSCSYWSPKHDVAVAECGARWEEDPAQRVAVWERIAAAPPPMGYDPSTAWPDGPEGEDWAVLHLQPWRVRAARAGDIASGAGFAAWEA
jgi:dienelactone hydrolase